MYNERIIVLKEINTIDKDGYRTNKTYEEIYKCWANINNLYGKELYSAYTVDLQNTLNCKVKYCKLLKDTFLNLSDNNRKKYKVKWNNIIYDISIVDFMSFNKKNVVFKLVNNT
ncbi:phage head closure protein (plasmid) [Sarcina sp. JB2]|uniref:Phage head closure protein n=1 Tax=Candidatus Sarcina troglodytae TaxID=2726954 RepID=A0ACD1BHB1_9CLOT|nr:phage head closure protein [Sarcina sp. JB2]QPJ86682.1 phage head closure protein [Sarcina sp. JB2]